MVDTKEEEEETKKSQKGNAIGGILGMLPSIAGAIPGLMKSKQTGALEDMQQGRGAGAMAARQAGSEAGRRTAGNVGGRGSSGQVRAGLRSAEEMTSRGAQTAGLIGAREGMFATQLLMGDEQRRRNLGLQLGTGIGGAAAAGLATGLAGADQGPEAPQGDAPGGDVQSALGQMVAPGPTELQMPVTGYQTQADFSPSLTPGSMGSPEGFGTLTTDQSLETVGGTDVATASDTSLQTPDTQLQEPAGGLQLPSLADPATMDQAKKRYRELTMRPESAPLSSPGGGDMSYIQQEEMRHWERNLDVMVQTGQLSEEEASEALRNKQMELAMRGGI
jgi:hypothetical protein